MLQPLWAVASLGLLFIRTADASLGDASPSYQECTSDCRAQFGCPLSFSSQEWATRYCFWCRYECMWKAVEVFDRHGARIPQFHGKWPFVSLMVAQEPASTVFSMLNLWSVFEMWRRVKRMRGLEMAEVWKCYTFVGMVTWLCSAWFHSVDYFISERADYFSAFAFVLYALYAALLFVFPALRRTLTRITCISAGFLYFYFLHVRRLSIHFDYGYNMTVCIGCSVITLIVYLWYLLSRWLSLGGPTRLQESDRTLLLLLTWTIASVGFEVLDFVPFMWTIDSHALFHAATVPLPLLTSRFLRLRTEEKQREYKLIGDDRLKDN